MRNNKYFLVLVSFFVFSSIILGIIFKKYVFLLFHHSVYYCQQVIGALPIRLPGNLGEASLTVLLVMFLYTTLKLVVTQIKTLKMRRWLYLSTVRSGTIKKLANRLELKNKVFVFKKSYPSAFCFGFWKPKIYLSTGLVKILSRSELEAVVRHEKYHLENKDAFVFLLSSMAQILLPFFPLISDISKKYRIQNEMAADEAAVVGMREAKSLVSVLKKLVAYEPKRSLALALSLADWNTLEFRIKRLLNKKIESKKIPVGSILISVISWLILGALAFTPVEALDNDLHSYYTCSSYDNQKYKSKPYSSYSSDRGRLFSGFFVD